MVNNSMFIPCCSAIYFSSWRTETGGLFRIAIKLMMALSPVEPKVYVPPHPCPLIVTNALHRDYVPLVNLIGVYFQIRDDYMNLQSSQVRSFADFMRHEN